MYESENVIIKYSRAIYHDIYGDVEETTDQVYKRYDNMTHFEVDRTAILIVSQGKRERTKIKQDSIMWRFHENYKETLDKYCFYSL